MEDEGLNNSCPGQNLILDGEDVYGAIDTDYFNFLASEGDCITIYTYNETGSSWPPNSYIELFTGCGRKLAWDDNGGGTVNSAIRNFRIPETGMYVVKLTQDNNPGNQTPYRMSISTTGLNANPTCSQPPQIGCGTIQLAGSTECAGNTISLGTNSSNTSAMGNEVLYSIEANSGDVLDITYTSTTDGTIYLITDCAAPLSTCVALSDSTFDGGSEHLYHAFTTPGTYYLVLDSFGYETSGTWTLSGGLSCGVLDVPGDERQDPTIRVVTQNNPVAGVLRFSVNADQTLAGTQLIVVNAVGRLIYFEDLGTIPQGQSGFVSDLPELSAGVYFYRIKSLAGQSSSNRFLVLK